MNDLYTKAQLVALNTYLAYWPDGLTYQQIIDHLIDEDLPEADAIAVCGDYEDLYDSHLVQLIESLHDDCVRVYGE